MDGLVVAACSAKRSLEQASLSASTTSQDEYEIAMTLANTSKRARLPEPQPTMTTPLQPQHLVPILVQRPTAAAAAAAAAPSTIAEAPLPTSYVALAAAGGGGVADDMHTAESPEGQSSGETSSSPREMSASPSQDSGDHDGTAPSPDVAAELAEQTISFKVTAVLSDGSEIPLAAYVDRHPGKNGRHKALPGVYYFHAKDRRTSPQTHLFSGWLSKEAVISKLKDMLNRETNGRVVDMVVTVAAARPSRKLQREKLMAEHHEAAAALAATTAEAGSPPTRLSARKSAAPSEYSRAGKVRRKGDDAGSDTSAKVKHETDIDVVGDAPPVVAKEPSCFRITVVLYDGTEIPVSAYIDRHVGVNGERNAGEFYFHAKDRRFSPQQHIFSSWMTRDEVLVKLKEHFERKNKDGVSSVTFDTVHSSARRKRLPPPPAVGTTIEHSPPSEPPPRTPAGEDAKTPTSVPLQPTVTSFFPRPFSKGTDVAPRAPVRVQKMPMCYPTREQLGDMLNKDRPPTEAPGPQEISAPLQPDSIPPPSSDESDTEDANESRDSESDVDVEDVSHLAEMLS